MSEKRCRVTFHACLLRESVAEHARARETVLNRFVLYDDGDAAGMQRY